MGSDTSRRIGFALMALALGTLCLVAPSSGQPPAQPTVIGAKNCFGCHDNGTQTYEKASKEFLLMQESKIWKEHDLHSKGYAALSSDLGKRMAEILRYDVTKDARCLVCHSVDLAADKPLGQKALADFHLESGVGCEACHGVATRWFAPHIAPTLRTAKPEQKEQLGMWDMRNPLRRAERCTSCHVGLASEGRFVTHEMYAAGHPPLPPLEVMAFSRDQQMHYKYPKEWSFITEMAKRNPEESWQLYHFRGEDDSTQARQVAAGAMTSLRATAQLLAEKAAAIDPAKEALDLAHFDCFACHHDLQSPSWRQARGFSGVPGRPQIRPGVALIAKLVAEHTANALNADAASPLRKFPESFKAVTDAFDARPFGEPAQVSQAAKGLVAWCDGVLKELDKVRYTREQIVQLMKMLVAAGEKKSPWLDADAAQQLVWSLESLRGEIEGPDGPIAQVLNKLRGNLPRHVRDTSNMNFIATHLGSRLQREYEFTPEQFHAVCAKLAATLK